MMKSPAFSYYPGMLHLWTNPIISVVHIYSISILIDGYGGNDITDPECFLFLSIDLPRMNPPLNQGSRRRGMGEKNQVCRMELQRWLEMGGMNKLFGQSYFTIIGELYTSV